MPLIIETFNHDYDMLSRINKLNVRRANELNSRLQFRSGPSMADIPTGVNERYIGEHLRALPADGIWLDHSSP